MIVDTDVPDWFMLILNCQRSVPAKQKKEHNFLLLLMACDLAVGFHLS